MTSHDAWTSGTSRVLIGTSLQRLKMEVLIPVPVDCEVRFVINFLQKLRRAIQNKRLGLLSAAVVLLHDNARPHTVRRPTHLQEFSWEVLNHPPYKPRPRTQ